MPRFSYRPYPHLSKKLLFPLVDIEILSKKDRTWWRISNILADTGASVTLLPFSLGQKMVNKVQSGKRIPIGGIVPGHRLTTWLHHLKIRINGVQISAPVAIAEGEVLPILGRWGFMDKLTFSFRRGRELLITR